MVHAHKGGYGGPGSLLRFAQDKQNPHPEEFLVIGEIIYGVAFHPDFETNGWMYVGCNGRENDVVMIVGLVVIVVVILLVVVVVVVVVVVPFMLTQVCLARICYVCNYDYCR